MQITFHPHILYGEGGVPGGDDPPKGGCATLSTTLATGAGFTFARSARMRIVAGGADDVFIITTPRSYILAPARPIRRLTWMIAK